MKTASKIEPKLTLPQVRILNALVGYEGDKITNEQLAARLGLPYTKFRDELRSIHWRVKKKTTRPSQKFLIKWWKKRLEWQTP